MNEQRSGYLSESLIAELPVSGLPADASPADRVHDFTVRTPSATIGAQVIEDAVAVRATIPKVLDCLQEIELSSHPSV